MPKVSGPIPAVVTAEESVSFGMSSSGGAAGRLVVGPDGAAVVAGVDVAGESVVAVPPTTVVVELTSVSVGRSSPHAPANTRLAAATKCTLRRRPAERVRGDPLLFTAATLAAVAAPLSPRASAPGTTVRYCDRSRKIPRGHTMSGS